MEATGTRIRVPSIDIWIGREIKPKGDSLRLIFASYGTDLTCRTTVSYVHSEPVPPSSTLGFIWAIDVLGFPKKRGTKTTIERDTVIRR